MGWGPISFAADVDDDGVQEIICDNAVYEPDGTPLWVDTNIPSGFPAIADFPQRPGPELVLVAGGNVYLHDAVNGDLLWGPTFVDSAGRGGAPTVADYDGDGEPEIGVAGLGYYTAIDTDGSVMWTNVTEDDSSSMTGSSVFDFNGDGVAEVVYADEHALYVYEGPTGDILFTADGHASGTLWETPVIVDIDHDFSAEIVVASNNMWWEGWTGITVLGAREASWYPARGIWNQHAYSITNVDDDGTIPANPATNWATYNNFRSADLVTAGGSGLPDAVPDLVETCPLECDQGHLRIVVRVGSAGLTNLPVGTDVALYAVSNLGDFTLLETRTTASSVSSGATTSGMQFDLDPADVPDNRLAFVVDDDGTGVGSVDECHEDNNQLLISDGLCQ
jgi:hypothetical protein